MFSNSRMSRKLWYLKQLNLFRALPEKQVKYISEQVHAKEYAKRQVVLEPEDHDKVFILKSGQVEIYQITQEGKKIIVDILGPGNVFGDLGVDESAEHFVEATTDSFVCVIGKNEFFQMVSKNPQIANTLVRELFTKIVEGEKQISALASDSLITKVKNLLLRLAKTHGRHLKQKVFITTKFTHEELANMIGISRQTMTEILNKLESQGIISRHHKIIAFDPQKLAQL